jgi:hypothetical protein
MAAASAVLHHSQTLPRVSKSPKPIDGFEGIFGIPVWYACFPPEEPHLCCLFRDRALGAGVR